jgi:hypothetical protein
MTLAQVEELADCSLLCTSNVFVLYITAYTTAQMIALAAVYASCIHCTNGSYCSVSSNIVRSQVKRHIINLPKA